MEKAILPSQQDKLHDETFAALYEIMKRHDDPINADRLLDIYEKWLGYDYIISFAGHFSAGKSTMINTLLDQDVLPESPIPTSANVVKITPGEEQATIFFHDQAPVVYEKPIDMAMIKDFCRDKQTIKRVELQTRLPFLKAGTALFDTPGIDAADDADRLMTESSMHLVDLLVYVMDYNHVQSEVNLHFLHSLNVKQIPFIVVINQIDKHDDRELSFQLFEQRVLQTFKDWDIKAESIYYTSLKDTTTTYNQFADFQQTIHHYLQEKQGWDVSIEQSVWQLIEEHRKKLTMDYEEDIKSFPDVSLTKTELSDQIANVKDRINAQERYMNELENNFKQEVTATLNNAYLLPHDTRELAGRFLESRQPDFKIGVLGSKKKTAAERDVRQSQFLEDIQAKIKATVQWRLRDKLSHQLKQFDIQNPKLMARIQQLTIDYNEDDLIQLINPGAKVNGQSVLNYANAISQDIKQRYKREAIGAWDDIEQKVKRDNETKQVADEQALTDLEQQLQQLHEQDAMREMMQQKYGAVKAAWHDPKPDLSVSLKEILNKRQTYSTDTPVKLPSSQDESSQVPVQDADQPLLNHANTITPDEMTQRIDQTIETVESLSGFQTIVNDLTEKRQRFDNQTYTVALFGAFSAGKSSFANALLGDHVLPVSPNPTTAAINRICPISTDHTHGVVHVHMKEAEALYYDLLTITKPFSPKANDLASLLAWIKDEEIDQRQDLKQLHRAYLSALNQGYAQHKSMLGKTITVQLDMFPSYVSDETKACFVESIDIYYDCALTRRGITLVDTPGADSINARHTNVAFDYIKYADAICFVTYYNHALSRADQDFLRQLGRVKDAFPLDKMFFMVNASDLAKDEQELQLVTNYIADELLQFGVREPKLYPISSKQSLQDKLAGVKLNDNMQYFEQAFDHFLEEELQALTIQAAEQDISRAYQLMMHYIESADMAEQDKEHYRQELSSVHTQLKQHVVEMDISLYHKQIEQKITKQLYYVQERIGIQFHDQFKDFFNPATITEAGKQATIQLRQSLDALLDAVGYECLQELRAVSLRIEAYMQSLADDAYTSLEQAISAIDSQVFLPTRTSFSFTTHDYDQALQDVDHQTFKSSLNLFKGTKAFFAKNEKETMKESLYEAIEPYIASYITTNQQLMIDSYQAQWQHLIKTMQDETLASINQSIEDRTSMLTETVDLAFLQQQQKKLSHILNMAKDQ